jgi:predicted DNA-binding ribbon-helix-helix protein
MSAITLRLPDDKHQRLKNLAEQRGMSINQLLNEMTTSLLADFDAEVRFRVRANSGSGKTERGIELLKKAMNHKEAE